MRRTAGPGDERPDAVNILRLAHVARRYLWRIIKPTTIGARVLVVRDNGMVLLVRHSYTRGWYLPGGGVRRGESTHEAAMREVREETGLVLEARPSVLGVYFSNAEGKNDHIVVYVIENSSADHPIPSSREIAEARFYDLRSLPDDVSPATRRRIDEFSGNEPIDGRW